MNGSSLLALALRDGNNDQGSDPKAALREQLAKGNVQKETNSGEQNADNGSDKEGEEEDNEEDYQKFVKMTLDNMIEEGTKDEGVKL